MSPNPECGEVVKAFVVLAEPKAESEALVRELQQHCKALTAPCKYPRKLAFVADKVPRGVLRRQEFGWPGGAVRALVGASLLANRALFASKLAPTGVGRNDHSIGDLYDALRH